LLSRTDGLILMVAFVAWLSLVIRDGLRTAGRGARGEKLKLSVVATGIAGLLLLFLAGHFIVVSSTAIAKALAIDPFLIGTIMVSVATGTPELATTLVAKLRGHHDLGLGNIYGSNIFNAWLILPLAALICPIEISDVTGVLVTLGFGVVTTISTHASQGVLGRDRGMLLLAQYAGFVAMLWLLARHTH
jgi:cation:H+ antiporter